MQTELRKIGIEPPRLYKMGFLHNNCGGFCIKAGQAHFAHLLKTMPDRYKFHEEKEQAMIARLTDNGASSAHFSILKDRRGGKMATLTLKMLRERIERGESFDRHEWGGCGCAIDAPVNCPECGGRGEITRIVPKYAIAVPGVPDDWTNETKECWRCHGDGVGRALGIDPNTQLCKPEQMHQQSKL